MGWCNLGVVASAAEAEGVGTLNLHSTVIL